MRHTRFFIIFAVLMVLKVLPVSGQTRLLRFPDVYGERVVFVYAGDLWMASTEGGTATRLTAHPGWRCSPNFPLTVNGSPSRGSMMATSKFMSCLRLAVCRAS